MQLPDPVELGDLLEPFSRRGIDLGLDRLHQALAAGGHPEPVSYTHLTLPTKA